MIPIKLRPKYLIGKIQGGPYSPRTGQGRNRSMLQELFASWRKHEPGKSLHAKEKERQAALPKKIMVITAVGKVKWRWSNGTE